MDNRKPCYTRSAEASGALNDSCCNSSNAEAGVLMVYHQVMARPFPKEGNVQSGGTSVMIWHECSWRDMGSLIRLDTTLIGDRYLKSCPYHLHSFMSTVHSDGLGQFQQDNGGTKWLQEHSSDFRHFH
ncbi:hypothetical protein AVEN_6650-1 [Araneus ventricosus]|uniref:Uncharacterized protein n=1 Tax=Araneus ventricosus TaxID=182803 RepID=A0A4Y2H264_ARAVE|nr:hypothetical protein AVEN_6650-1 [Araneus ventricosus]